MLAAVALAALLAPFPTPAADEAVQSDNSGAKRKNVLLVVMDTTRFDDWSWLDPARSETPTLDDLTKRGTAFTQAHSLYTVTLPSHVTIFTGSEVPRGKGAPSTQRAASLFTILGEHGYRTYASSGNELVSPTHVPALRSVHARGGAIERFTTAERLKEIEIANRFEVSDELREKRHWAKLVSRHEAVMRRDARAVNGGALALLQDHVRAHSDAPFLLFVNYNDAHDPYFPEPPWLGKAGKSEKSDFNGDIWDPRQRDTDFPVPTVRFAQSIEGLSAADLERARALHLAEVSYADHHLGKLLQELQKLQLLDDTVVVVTADHGEFFGEHDRMSHSGPRLEELTHVPLLFVLPTNGFEPGQIDAPVDLRDIKPTLLEILEIADPGSQGRSLVPLMRSADAVLPQPAPISDNDPSSNLLDLGKPEQLDRLRNRLKALGYIE